MKVYFLIIAQFILLLMFLANVKGFLEYLEYLKFNQQQFLIIADRSLSSRSFIDNRSSINTRVFINTEFSLIIDILLITNLQLSNVIAIILRETHFQSKEEAGNKSCIVVTIFNAACTLGRKTGGIGNITIHHAAYRSMRKNTFFCSN